MDGLADIHAIQEVDSRPDHTWHIARRTSARPMPRRHRHTFGSKQIDEMTAGESRRASDQSCSWHVTADD